MFKGLSIWGTVFSSLLGSAYFAAANGTGIAQPSKQPPSIREGSVNSTSGARTRYFIGGGLHRGK